MYKNRKQNSSRSWRRVCWHHLRNVPRPKVEGNIGLVTDYLASWPGPCKTNPGSHLVVAAVFHSVSPGHNHPEVPLAERRTGRSSKCSEFHPGCSSRDDYHRADLTAPNLPFSKLHLIDARSVLSRDHHSSVTFWNMSVLAQLSDEIVVFLVCANPKPDREIAVSLRKSAIVISDSH